MGKLNFPISSYTNKKNICYNVIELKKVEEDRREGS